MLYYITYNISSITYPSYVFNLVQAEEYGKYVGRANFFFRNGDSTLLRYTLIPVNLKKRVEQDSRKVYVFIDDTIQEDASMLALLELFQKKWAEILNVNIIGLIQIIYFKL